VAIERRLVIFLKRPGGQSQFSAHLAAQIATEGRIQAVQHWVLDHLPLDLTVNALASRAGMSVRNFTRNFLQEAGITPADLVEMARVDSARRLLEDTDIPLQRVASNCGFANPDTMRRAFLRRIATAPSEYRKRFCRRTLLSAENDCRPFCICRRRAGREPTYFSWNCMTSALSLMGLTISAPDQPTPPVAAIPASVSRHGRCPLR
jgi:AraC-like DNA-binding protein